MEGLLGKMNDDCAKKKFVPIARACEDVFGDIQLARRNMKNSRKL